VKRLIPLTSLSLIAVLALAPSAFAQGSFCTTTAAASGVSVTRCVDAPSPTATASPDVTVINGGPLTPSPTATAAVTGGAASNPVVAAVGGKLPPTGGAGRLAVMAAVLLVGSGAMSYAILRRSN
jgi:hypothetical protein